MSQKIVQSLCCGNCIHSNAYRVKQFIELHCDLFTVRVMSYYPFCEAFTWNGLTFLDKTLPVCRTTIDTVPVMIQ